MSTRCNIWVDDGKEPVQLYHHCDGYPEGVGEELVTAVKMCLMQTHRKFNDGEVTVDVAELRKNLLGLLASVVDYGDKSPYEFEGNDLNIHGDIEYLYYVGLYDKGVDVRYGDDETGFPNLESFRNKAGTELF